MPPRRSARQAAARGPSPEDDGSAPSVSPNTAHAAAHDALTTARGTEFIAGLKAQSAAFHERRRPRGLYRLLAPLHRKYDQYEMTTGLYMLDLWEKALVNTLLLLLLSLAVWGATKQLLVLSRVGMAAVQEYLEQAAASMDASAGAPS